MLVDCVVGLQIIQLRPQSGHGPHFFELDGSTGPVENPIRFIVKTQVIRVFYLTENRIYVVNFYFLSISKIIILRKYLMGYLE